MPRVLLLLVVVCVALSGCGAGEQERKESTEEPRAVRLSPTKGVYVGARFNTEPSTYLGKFVPDDVPGDQVGAVSVIETVCSQYLTVRKVKVKGFHDQYFRRTHETGETVETRSRSHDRPVENHTTEDDIVRVKFGFTEKLRAEKTPEYARCCRANADSCTGRSVGEVWAGTGTVYEILGPEGVVKDKYSKAERRERGIEFRDGVAWQPVRRFKDAYFAISLNEGSMTAASLSKRRMLDENPAKLVAKLLSVEPSQPSGLQVENLHEALAQSHPEVEHCVDRAVGSGRRAAGTLVLILELGDDGQVFARVPETSEVDAALGSCVVESLSASTHIEPWSDTAVTVRVTYEIRPEVTSPAEQSPE